MTDYKPEVLERLNKWKILCELRSCIWCNKPFEHGVVISMPRDTETPMMSRFRGEFLFHTKDTHGFDAEMLSNMLKKLMWNNEINRD